MAYPGAHGLKTGATPNAGYCLVAAATRFGRSMMTVVMGCANDTARHNEAKQLLDFGFSFPKIASVNRPLSDPSSGQFIITGQSLPNASITIRAAPSLPGPFSFLGAPNPWVGQQWGYEVLLAWMYGAAGWLVCFMILSSPIG